MMSSMNYLTLTTSVKIILRTSGAQVISSLNDLIKISVSKVWGDALPIDEHKDFRFLIHVLGQLSYCTEMFSFDKKTVYRAIRFTTTVFALSIYEQYKKSQMNFSSIQYLLQSLYV